MTAIERAGRDLKRSQHEREKAIEAEGYSKGKFAWAMYYADVLETALAALVEEAQYNERWIRGAIAIEPRLEHLDLGAEYTEEDTRRARELAAAQSEQGEGDE